MVPRSSPAGARGGMKNERELLVLGAGGMLGTALARVALDCAYSPRTYTEEELDITDRPAVRDAIADFASQTAKAGSQCAVVNAAAYTDVERAEDQPDRAYLVNDCAAGWLAEAARESGLAFVHVSTDFVFDGAKGTPYSEIDRPNPLSVYGASKLAGEQAVFSAHPDALVIRTAWTYGLGGVSFPLKILQRAQALIADSARTGPPAAATAADAASGEKPPLPVLRVVADEVGSPTYSVDLAIGLLALLSGGAAGLYHLAGTGSCSRYELALETLRLAGVAVPGDITVEPVTSADFPTKARRPRFGALDCGRAAALGVQLPAWQDGLRRYVSLLHLPATL